MTKRHLVCLSIAAISCGLLAGTADAAAPRSDLGSWAKVEGLATTWPTGRPIIVTDLSDPSSVSQGSRSAGSVAWVSGRGGTRGSLEPRRGSYVLTHVQHRARY